MRVVCPGDISKSALYQRVTLTGTLQMPPLARNVVDEEAMKMLREWINHIAPVQGIERSLLQLSDLIFRSHRPLLFQFRPECLLFFRHEFFVSGGIDQGTRVAGLQPFVLAIQPEVIAMGAEK